MEHWQQLLTVERRCHRQTMVPTHDLGLALTADLTTETNRTLHTFGLDGLAQGRLAALVVALAALGPVGGMRLGPDPGLLQGTSAVLSVAASRPSLVAPRLDLTAGQVLGTRHLVLVHRAARPP